MNTIILKHGPGVPKKVGSTVLSPGEPGWSTDLDQLYVGTTDPQAPARVGGGSDSFVNVKDFGATGDGVTDDTASFTRACGAALTGGKHKAVYIPTGHYVVGSILSQPEIQLTIFGDHRDLSQIHCSGTVAAFEATANARIAMSAMRANIPSAATKPFIRCGSRNLQWITISDCTLNAGTLATGKPIITCPNASYTSGLVVCTRSVFTGGVIAMDSNSGNVRLFMIQCSMNNPGWDNFAKATLTDCSVATASAAHTGAYL